MGGTREKVRRRNATPLCLPVREMPEWLESLHGRCVSEDDPGTHPAGGPAVLGASRRDGVTSSKGPYRYAAPPVIVPLARRVGEGAGCAPKTAYAERDQR